MLVSKPYTFSNGATIVASEHNADFDALYNVINGNIGNDNLISSAAIADSKLGQITTPSKVTGAALATLSGVPSSAGYIPVANLPTGITYNKLVTLTTSNNIQSNLLASGATSTSVFLRGDLTWASITTEIATYDSGWLAQADTALTHNLNSTRLLFSVLAATDTNGTNANPMYHHGNNDTGCAIYNVTTTGLKVIWKSNIGYIYIDSSSTWVNTWGFQRVIATKV